MADLNSNFFSFHERIKVDAEPLVEKRDILLNTIRKYLRENRHPGFDLINQGSYIYGVGIEPLGDREHDIDVGLGFNILTIETQATAARDWVLKAVKDHTNKVKEKGPCIRVHYAAGFHVDLVTYAKYKSTKDVEDFHLGHKDEGWLLADPKGLKAHIENGRTRFVNTRTNSVTGDQLQRVVRYLKRWNDIRLPDESNDKPVGIALLLFALQHLQPTFDRHGNPDDVEALQALCQKAATSIPRILARKPIRPFDDVFARISDQAMTDLRRSFGDLGVRLQAAQREVDEVVAAESLSDIFGDDFPVGERLVKAFFKDAMIKNDQLSAVSAHDRVTCATGLQGLVASAKNPTSPHSSH